MATETETGFDGVSAEMLEGNELSSAAAHSNLIRI